MSSKVLPFLRQVFYNTDVELRIRVFNLLAVVGVLVSSIAGVSSVLNNGHWILTAMNFFTAIVSGSLLVYATKAKAYEFCCVVTIVLIFMVLFPGLFITGGGYRSGMPCFFVFAFVFTAFLLRGIPLLLSLIAELVIYVSLILIAYYQPELITWFSTEEAFVDDLLLGMIASGLALATTMFFLLRMYDRQQIALKEAQEKALAANEAKNVFLANMSHEIRTPINVILGMNEMILRKTDSDQVLNYATQVEHSSRHLITLINNVLDMSAIESGKVNIYAEHFDLRALVQEIFLIGINQAEEKSLSFQIIAEPALPRFIVGDALHTKQVVLNLLNNAVKYTERGSVKLTLSQDDGLLVCVVKDTGIGIHPDEIDTLFDSFARANCVNDTFEGSGLGLAIAKELTEQMGGHIQVESVLGKGSVFTLFLPLERAGDELLGEWSATDVIERPEQAQSFFAPTASVLIVDDHMENLNVASSLLQHTGVRRDFALSGKECVEKVRAMTYDLIFLDIRMPEQDGIETFRQLNELSGFKTPVVALTADTTGDIQSRLAQEGFAGYVPKPIQWQELEDACREHIEGSRIVSSADEHTSSVQLSSVQKKQMESCAQTYDITMQDGLDLLQNDIAQYVKLLDLFSLYYESNLSQLQESLQQVMRAEQDAEAYEHFAIHVHALKSSAKAIGALALSDLARTLEERGLDKDRDFIMNANQLLLLEWERAVSGARKLVDLYEQFCSVSVLEEQAVGLEDDRELLTKLKSAVNSYQSATAEEIATSWLDASDDELLKDELERILSALHTLDYDAAEAACDALGRHLESI